jgi:hypothetical protein
LGLSGEEGNISNCEGLSRVPGWGCLTRSVKTCRPSFDQYDWFLMCESPRSLGLLLSA